MLHVISYGPQIVDKKKIFELYHREQKNVDGLGIGMYIVKKFAEAHGWLANLESKSEYDYNIPCLAHYYRELNNPKIQLLSRCTNSQIEKIRNLKGFSEDNFDDVLNRYPVSSTSDSVKKEMRLVFRPGSKTFSDEFEKPTYKNDFIITITKNN